MLARINDAPQRPCAPCSATPAAPLANISPTSEQRISLALQGGGALGAFTWGVLDQLLETGICVDAISGASAGAINAVLMASGLAQGGPEQARRTLESFWSKLGRYALPLSSEMMLAASVRLISPYQFNPLDLNPVRDLLASEVDFQRLQASKDIRLLISATRVSDGALRIFRNEEITADAVMASACLPHIHQAVSVEGEPYWDGGYASNPPLLGLVAESEVPDLLLVQLIPTHGADLPRTKRAIESRVNQITFNTPLQGELEALSTMIRLCEGEGEESASPLSHKLQALRLHRIAAEDHVEALDDSSTLHADRASLLMLRDRGRAAAARWLGSDTGAAG